jgi:hypothetical protein
MKTLKNYWVFGLFPLSGVVEMRKKRFENRICSHPQEGGY